MSLWKAIEVMDNGNIVIHKDVAYTIINERICACRFDTESEILLHHHEIDSSIQLLAILFDNFVPHPGMNVFKRPPVPEFYVIEDGTLYDFSLVPNLDCPVCFTSCSASTVYREGKYALCPGCNRRIWRASRYDGISEMPSPKQAENKSEKPDKPDKPKPPTNEEIIEALLGDSSKILERKLKF